MEEDFFFLFVEGKKKSKEMKILNWSAEKSLKRKKKI